MALYYVGPGGNNGNNGTSWATRRLTLTSIETLVAAGDTVYVGPGVYREQLTCTASGSSGSPITYVADVTGAYTDGVGGVVRVTGSDNDLTATRSEVLTINTRSYRTFRGFHLDTVTGGNVCIITISTGTNWIIEDCCLSNADTALYLTGATTSGTMRRCLLFGLRGGCIFQDSGTTNGLHVIERCVFLASSNWGAKAIEVQNNCGGWTVRNCLFAGMSYGVGAYHSTTMTNPITVNNCIFSSLAYGLDASHTGNIVENYNQMSQVSNPRTNVATGANSNSYPYLPSLPLLFSGMRLSDLFFVEHGQWSQTRALTDTGTVNADLFGSTPPATNGKRSWGPVQYSNQERTTAQTYGSSTAALRLPDAGAAQFIVPCGAAVSTTVSVRVYREANYAGTNPQMIIRQPGQADRTTADTGSSGTWNLLSDTFTPAADPDYVVVELGSNNTATSGSYVVYFDDLAVS